MTHDQATDPQGKADKFERDMRFINEPPTKHPRIQGRCPSCHAESLFLGSCGYVTCSVIGCKDPGAATDLLTNSATALAAAEARGAAQQADDRCPRCNTWPINRAHGLDGIHESCLTCGFERLLLPSPSADFTRGRAAQEERELTPCKACEWPMPYDNDHAVCPACGAEAGYDDWKPQPDLRTWWAEHRTAPVLVRNLLADIAAAESRGTRAAGLREAAIAIKRERLDDPQVGTSDDGYEAAITDCLNAVRALATEADQ